MNSARTATRPRSFPHHRRTTQQQTQNVYQNVLPVAFRRRTPRYRPKTHRNRQIANEVRPTTVNMLLFGMTVLATWNRSQWR